MTHHHHPFRASRGLRLVSFRLFTLLLLLSIAALAAACAARQDAGSSGGREATLRQIAVEYSQTGDLKQAQAALDKLNLANPAQLLLAVAEADLSSGGAREDIAATARLAEALGARSPKVAAYLTPSPAPVATQVAQAATAVPAVLAATIEAPTAEPASPTAEPPTAAPTVTPEPATATTAPPTSSPTPEPQNPRVLAGSDVNLRGGPGKGYPIV
ncbi:MAG: hypothetical protein ACM30E_10820, partial [Nitrososphaerales archaeon]